MPNEFSNTWIVPPSYSAESTARVCADGGAAYLSITREGVASRHEMEFGDPPSELAELDAIALSLIDALTQCAATEFVEVGDDCVPYER